MPISPPSGGYGNSSGAMFGLIAQAMANAYRETPQQRKSRENLTQFQSQRFQEKQQQRYFENQAQAANLAGARDSITQYQRDVASGRIVPGSQANAPRYRGKNIPQHRIGLGLFGVDTLAQIPDEYENLTYLDPRGTALADREWDDGLMAHVEENGPFQNLTDMTATQREYVRTHEEIIPEVLAADEQDLDDAERYAEILIEQGSLDLQPLLDEIRERRAEAGDTGRGIPSKYLSNVGNRIQQAVSAQALADAAQKIEFTRRQTTASEMNAVSSAQSAQTAADRLELNRAETEAGIASRWTTEPLLDRQYMGVAKTNYPDVPMTGFAGPDVTLGERQALGSVDSAMLLDGLSEEDAISLVAGEDKALNTRLTDLRAKFVPWPKTENPSSAYDGSGGGGGGKYIAPPSIFAEGQKLYGPANFSSTTQDNNHTEKLKTGTARLQTTPQVWEDIRNMNLSNDEIGNTPSESLTEATVERLIRSDPEFATAWAFTNNMLESQPGNRASLTEQAFAAASDSRYTGHMPSDRTLTYIQMLAQAGPDGQDGYARAWGNGNLAEANNYFRNFKKIARDHSAGEKYTPERIASLLGPSASVANTQAGQADVPAEHGITDIREDSFLDEYQERVLWKNPQMTTEWKNVHNQGYEVGRFMKTLQDYDDARDTDISKPVLEVMKRMAARVDTSNTGIIRDLNELKELIPNYYVTKSGERTRSDPSDWLKGKLDLAIAWLSTGGSSSKYMNEILPMIGVGYTMVEDDTPDPLTAYNNYMQAIRPPQTGPGMGTNMAASSRAMGEQWWEDQLRRRGAAPDSVRQ